MESDETVDLLAYLSRLKRFWLPALAVGLLVLAAVTALGMRSAPVQYATKAHVLVTPPTTDSAAEADLQAQMFSQTMRTFVALDDVPALVDPIVKATGGKFTAQQVKDMTSIYWGGGSRLLAVRVQAPNEADALALAQAGAEALAAHGAEVLHASAQQAPQLTVVEGAKIDPDVPVASTSRLSGVPTGLVAGLGAGLLTAFLLELLSSRRRAR